MSLFRRFLCYCYSCGNEISSEAVICIHCGAAVKNIKSHKKTPILGFIFSFIFPIIGLILSIVEYNMAKSEGDNTSLAKAGIVISSIFCGFLVLQVIYFLSILVL